MALASEALLLRSNQQVEALLVEHVQRRAAKSVDVRIRDKFDEADWALGDLFQSQRLVPGVPTLPGCSQVVTVQIARDEILLIVEEVLSLLPVPFGHTLEIL